MPLRDKAQRQPALPLPIRDGVAPSYLWLPEGSWANMLDFLVERYPAVSADAWRERMARGDVVDGEGRPLQPSSRYRRGMRIFYYRELEQAETPIPFQEEILFQDEHLVVVDKPHFLPMIPTGRFLHETLLVRLKKKLNLPDLTPIHRLDRETAGVVVFSSNIASRVRSSRCSRSAKCRRNMRRWRRACMGARSRSPTAAAWSMARSSSS